MQEREEGVEEFSEVASREVGECYQGGFEFLKFGGGEERWRGWEAHLDGRCGRIGELACVIAVFMV